MGEEIKNNVIANAPERDKDFVFPLSVGQVLVTGIGKYTKDGRTSYILHGVTPFEEFQIEAGSYGMASINEFTNRVDLSFLTVGDVITCQYGKGFQGRAVLINCAKVGHVSGKLSL